MLEIEIGTHRFQVLPQRALYWAAQEWLLIADLHLGKADTFRHFGVAVPQAVQWSDLERLAQLLAQLQPKKCVVLGDFVHGRIVQPSTAQAWNALVAAYPQTQFELLAGNHDRALERHVLKLHAVKADCQIDGVWLTHEPLPQEQLIASQYLNIHGHIHPAIRLEGSRAKLPALVYRRPYLMMPAFSEFTAGVAAHGLSDSVWVFAPDAPAVLRVQ